jgi:hypothetical protein
MYGILKDNGELVLDSGWQCEADVVAGYHGFGAGRVYGALLYRDTDAADWQVVHPSPTSKEATHGHK